jgi:hypothetical protein
MDDLQNVNCDQFQSEAARAKTIVGYLTDAGPALPPLSYRKSQSLADLRPGFDLLSVTGHGREVLILVKQYLC